MSAETKFSNRRMYEIPQDAIYIGTFGGATYSYHRQTFIDHATGMDHAIILSPLQHRLFVPLLAHEGEFIPVDKLFRYYYPDLPANYVLNGIEEAITIHPAMSRLRNRLYKINPDLKTAIQTTWSRGYRFNLNQK